MNTLIDALLTAFTTPFVTFALAMLGAYWGAVLSRRTEYEKWFRQEKSKAFAELLSELNDIRLASADAMYDTALPESQREMRTTELFARLRKHEAVARLYMSEFNRAELGKGMSSLWLATTTNGCPANHAIRIKQIALIQSLLSESCMHHQVSSATSRSVRPV